MEILILVLFVLGYTAIALEHSVHVDKAASALMTGVLCWAVFVLGMSGISDGDLEANFPRISEGFHHLKSYLGDSEFTLPQYFDHRLLHHMEEISSILFFLLGAMTIVELIDAHEGFSVITDRIKTTNKAKLLWIIAILTFFFSAALDNLTTSIVMISLLRKLISDQRTRWLYAGIVVIAANAGGAWSPIGDVTTTMLWIGGQLSTVAIIKTLIIPSLVCMIVPVSVLSLTMKGDIQRKNKVEGPEHYLDPTTPFERNLIFTLGVLGLLFVPVFKTVTHLPPFMGMMLSLGVIWTVTEILHHKKNREQKSQLSVIGVLRKIDTASVLFFLGILLAVSALQEVGHLIVMAEWLKDSLNDVYAINIAIGLLSAIVDNVPLVAASMGMYEISPATVAAGSWEANFVQDGTFWKFLAYCAGTGGSALIIGSAAGVAVMGMERIDFVWYLKKISLLAVLGYFAGAFAYILMF